MLLAYGTSLEIRSGNGVYLNFGAKGISYRKCTFLTKRPLQNTHLFPKPILSPFLL